MVKVKLPDGSILKVKAGRKILEALPKGVGLVAKVDGELKDLSVEIRKDWKIVEILDFEAEDGKRTYWHTSAHILAQAVKRLFPEAKLGVGPAIENGFYYDFDLDGKTFTKEDLENIEKEAYNIIGENLPIERMEMKREEAVELFSKLNEPYKIELLKEIQEEKVTIYRQGEFVDLCRGPHLPFTGYIEAFKILGVSSAYWRGDERNPIMQRIYGISFPSRKQLEEYLKIIGEARRRDHRLLGQRLNLFSMPTTIIGPGLVLWHPKGALARKYMEDFLREIHIKNGYQIVYTPQIAYIDLWRKSGHLEYYKDMMYIFEKDGIKHVVKPMNCPFHILIYKSKTRSYRELPIRYFELGTVSRYERSGTLHGLLRVRSFTQDDAHIFCREDQLEEEIINVLTLMEKILSIFGFKEYEVELSTMDPDNPEKYMGSPIIWNHAQRALIQALERKGYRYVEAAGEAAFYGPKIDVKLVDSLGRRWQCTTIQVDFNLPERFNVTYMDEKGEKKKVVMIHRTILGSIERFFGILVEHYNGELPLWMNPIQVRIIPVSDRYTDYAKKIYEELRVSNIRVEVDLGLETVAYKVRRAEIERVPYILIVGRREEEHGTISVRRRRKGNLGEMTTKEFIRMIDEKLKWKEII
ncbi:MAG: threonine--tRNA ligase [archaeon GB-1845-036]|nr:threonine--tRNA ligase [Candidatus Culexmicrobium thermophilum]